MTAVVIVDIEQMKNTAHDEIFWLFELEDDGTVLHSSQRSQKTPVAGLVGKNFFEEQNGFTDLKGFERQFREFIKGRKAAESHVLKCSDEQGVFDAKVRMTRGFQTNYCPPQGVVLLEIRNL